MGNITARIKFRGVSGEITLEDGDIGYSTSWEKEQPKGYQEMFTLARYLSQDIHTPLLAENDIRVRTRKVPRLLVIDFVQVLNVLKWLSKRDKFNVTIETTAAQFEFVDLDFTIPHLADPQLN